MAWTSSGGVAVCLHHFFANSSPIRPGSLLERTWLTDFTQSSRAAVRFQHGLTTMMTTCDGNSSMSRKQERTMMRFMKLAAVAAVLVPCSSAALAGGKSALKGEIKIDGSSTVYLISEAMATNF